ncbi:MAG: MOSC domain-containing protein [Acidobacteria bacterium]|nr:MOSC domain-containing protein [Acidobacteriota bacterium]
MKVKYVSVGLPQIVDAGNENFVTTAIFKKPVDGTVRVGELNIEGDGQADLRVHGGPTKAVYCYPSEHYEFWAKEMPDHAFEPANFGENLTTEGLLESDLFIGDRLRVGTAEFVVTEPRMPCYKLGVRFGRKDIIRRFLQSLRSGFYLGVQKTGELQAGDTIEFVSRDATQISVRDIVRIFAFERDDHETMEKALELDSLPESWKSSFRELLAR